MSDGVNIELDQARAFLVALTGEPDCAVCWQTFDDDKKRKSGALVKTWTATLDQAMAELQRLNAAGAGIFIAVNHIEGHRQAENVKSLRALFIDADGTAAPDHFGREPCFGCWRDATHWHAYWTLVPGESLDQFTKAQVHLAAYYRTDEKIGDLPRVMRVPGFIHNKSSPVPVHFRPKSRNPATIAEIIAAHPVDWDQVPDVYRRKAESVGLIPKKAHVENPKPASTTSPQAKSRDLLQRFDDAFRRYCAPKETTVGKQDTTAFTIACHGYARLREGKLSSEVVIREVVTDYINRCGTWTDIAREVDRLMRSAASKDRGSNTHELKIGRGGRPAADRAPAGPPSASEDAFADEPVVIEDEGTELVPSSAGSGGGSGGKPPASDQSAASGDEPEKFGGISLDALAPAWHLGFHGVSPWKRNTEGSLVVNYVGRITDLPIWPEQQGLDAATGASWWKIGWLDNRGKPRHQWLADEAMRDGPELIKLPDGPVTSAKFRKVADYLTCARRAVTKPTIEVLSRVGWVGINGGRRWVWPSDDANVQYIGPPLATHGDVEGWRKGVDALIAAGVDGYTALTAVCFSVASPFVRLASSRAPIYGLVCRSSSGKGSALDYAISVWAMPNELRVPASSTVKGLQDRAAGVPDLPIFLDELQQLVEAAPLQAGSALYYLANGQRRVTSSQKQIAVGGEARHGVAFYAAEAAVLPGQNTGVHYRCIESDLQPCPSAEVARILQHASEHYGVLAPQIAEQIRSRPPSDWQDLIRGRANRIQADFPGLKGGDAVAIALWRTGAEILGRLLDADWDYQAHQQWLVDRILGQRSQTEARDIQALEAILTVVLKQHWTETDTAGKIEYKPEICLQGSPLAWSIWSSAETGGACEQVAVDIDPNHAALAELFRQHGGEAVLLRLWRDRGWIQAQGNHLKVKRFGKGRVIRFTKAALDHVQGETCDIA